MRIAKLREFWKPHSIMIAMNFNKNRPKGKAPLSPEALNPYADPKEMVKDEPIKDTKAFLAVMKAQFYDKPMMKRNKT